MIHKTGKELVVITTSITYSWFSVTKIFNVDLPSQDGDRTTFQVTIYLRIGIIHRFSRLVTLLYHKWLHVRLNHKDACILTLA